MKPIPDHFSLVKEHPHSYEINDAKKDLNFHIAKKDMSLDMHAKLAKIRHYDEGTPDGAVGSQADDSAQGISNNLTQGTPLAQGNYVQAPDSSAPTGASGDWSAQAAATPQGDQTPTPGQKAPTADPNDPMAQFNQNSRLEQQGVMDKANAEGKIGQQQAAQIDASNKALIGAHQDAQANREALDWKVNKIADGIAASQIDPKSYINNMSTGNKILSAISIGLGGIGGGLSGQPNMALGLLHKNIAEDIDAQKANLGKQENLLGHYMQQYGNLHQAEQATYMHLNAVAQGQLAKIAATNAGPMAQANAKVMLGQLKNQQQTAGMQLQQMVTTNNIRKSLKSGAIDPSTNPLDFVQYVVPADKQKDVATQIGQAQAAKETEQKMMDTFDNVDKENTIMKTGAGLVRTPPSVKVFEALADPLIHDNEGRINELEQKHVQALMPQPGDRSSTLEEKRQGLQDFINHKKDAPLAQTFGIDINKFKSSTSNPVVSFNPQQKSYYNWAQQNPNDPRSQTVLKKLGVK